MKAAAKTFDNAGKLEKELAELAESLAATLQKPASERDPQQMATGWQAMAALRPQMQAIGRQFNRLEKPVRGQLARKDYAARQKDYAWARSFKKRLGMWESMARMVQQHEAPVRQPLLPPLPASADDALLNRIYAALHRLANPNNQDSSAREYGCYADIDFPIRHFDRLMAAAYRVALAQNRRRALRFLDVGCGGGTKILAASPYFAAADGLEYDRGYADAAQQTLHKLGLQKSTVFHADALHFNSYADYDVIYFFRPMQDDTLLAEMEQRIMAQARRGTIMIAPYDAPMSARAGLECARIEGPVFVTGVSQAEADQLKADAEATGTRVLRRSADWPFDPGYWAPLLDTASFDDPRQTTTLRLTATTRA